MPRSRREANLWLVAAEEAVENAGRKKKLLYREKGGSLQRSATRFLSVAQFQMRGDDEVLREEAECRLNNALIEANRGRAKSSGGVACDIARGRKNGSMPAKLRSNQPQRRILTLVEAAC